MKSKRRPQLPMNQLIEEFLDLIYWRFNKVLIEEDVSALQWTFMQRALYRYGRGVPFSAIIKATGESKDNVRRAAESLRRLRIGIVEPDPEDRRARLFILTKFGQRITQRIKAKFEHEMLGLLGARHHVSGRVADFNWYLWHATGYLESGDLADGVLKAYRNENRRAFPDDTPAYLRDENLARSVWAQKDDSEEAPF